MCDCRGTNSRTQYYKLEVLSTEPCRHTPTELNFDVCSLKKVLFYSSLLTSSFWRSFLPGNPHLNEKFIYNFILNISYYFTYLSYFENNPKSFYFPGACIISRFASWLSTIWVSLQAVFALAYIGMFISKSMPFTECVGDIKLAFVSSWWQFVVISITNIRVNIFTYTEWL